MKKHLAKKIFKVCAIVLTVLLGLCAIVSAYAGTIDPASWALPSVLVLMFVPMAVMLLIVAIVWFICRNWIMGSICILMLFLCGPAWRDNFPLHLNNPKPEPGEKVLTLLSYNVNNLEIDRNSGKKTSPVLSYIIASGADIVCLQESYGYRYPFINAFPEQADSIRKIYPYRVDYNGNELLTLSKYPIHSYRHTEDMEDLRVDTRLADIIEMDYNGMPIVVVNVHLTSYGLDDQERDVLGDVNRTRHSSKTILSKLENSFVKRAEFAANLKEKIEKIHSRDVIVCGDFNDVPGSYTYRTMLGDDMKDAYAETGFGPMVTFNAFHLYFHIDQVMYRGDNIRALSCKRGSLRNSDHFPVITRFAISPN